MLKLQSLRRVIEQAVPDLVIKPENLIVLANKGRAVGTSTNSLSFEYRYTAQITILDYAGHMDALLVPIIAWAKRNQNELFENANLRENAIRFNVEYLTKTTVDIGIEIDLTERAIVTPDPNHTTRVNVEHPPEPCHMGSVCEHEHWQLWLRDEKMLAEWRIEPPPHIDRFGV